MRQRGTPYFNEIERAATLDLGEATLLVDVTVALTLLAVLVQAGEGDNEEGVNAWKGVSLGAPKDFVGCVMQHKGGLAWGGRWD
jgi:hypothetical protein